tara:strand:+ start:420 stop:650 length:231 start_codon:yes stop_codon:yes gene_type:complete
MTDNVLNIDGQQYKETDLTDRQKYLINQLKDVTTKANSLRGQLDQVQRAANSFQEELLASFKDKAKEVLKKEEVNG